MTFKTIRDQCRETLLQRAGRQAKIDQRAADVIEHVMSTVLIRAPDVKVVAFFNGHRRGGKIIAFLVHVWPAPGAIVKGVYNYWTSPDQQPTVMALGAHGEAYAETAQLWDTSGARFDDVIDAILDATGWTLEDVSWPH